VPGAPPALNLHADRVLNDDAYGLIDDIPISPEGLQQHYPKANGVDGVDGIADAIIEAILADNAVGTKVERLLLKVAVDDPRIYQFLTAPPPATSDEPDRGTTDQAPGNFYRAVLVPALRTLATDKDDAKARAVVRSALTTVYSMCKSRPSRSGGAPAGGKLGFLAFAGEPQLRALAALKRVDGASDMTAAQLRRTLARRFA
jgi:hypothetical protein